MDMTCYDMQWTCITRLAKQIRRVKQLFRSTLDMHYPSGERSKQPFTKRYVLYYPVTKKPPSKQDSRQHLHVGEGCWPRGWFGWWRWCGCRLHTSNAHHSVKGHFLMRHVKHALCHCAGPSLEANESKSTKTVL